MQNTRYGLLIVLISNIIGASEPAYFPSLRELATKASLNAITLPYYSLEQRFAWLNKLDTENKEMLWKEMVKPVRPFLTEQAILLSMTAKNSQDRRYYPSRTATEFPIGDVDHICEVFYNTDVSKMLVQTSRPDTSGYGLGRDGRLFQFNSDQKKYEQSAVFADVKDSTMSKNGMVCAIYTHNNELRIYEPDSKRYKHVTNAGQNVCFAPPLQLNHDGTRCAIINWQIKPDGKLSKVDGRFSKAVSILDIQTGKTIFEKDHIGHFAMSDNGETLLILEYNHTNVLSIWQRSVDSSNYIQHSVLHGYGASVNNISISDDGTLFAIGKKGEALIFRTAYSQPILHIKGSNDIYPSFLRNEYILVKEPCSIKLCALDGTEIVSSQEAGEDWGLNININSGEGIIHIMKESNFSTMNFDSMVQNADRTVDLQYVGEPTGQGSTYCRHATLADNAHLVRVVTHKNGGEQKGCIYRYELAGKWTTGLAKLKDLTSEQSLLLASLCQLKKENKLDPILLKYSEYKQHVETLPKEIQDLVAQSLPKIKRRYAAFLGVGEVQKWSHAKLQKQKRLSKFTSAKSGIHASRSGLQEE